VAHALGELPALTDALAEGELSFSAVRELTRVATPATEYAWMRAGCSKNLRQIEELVAGRRPGDLPETPADPDLRMRVVRYELRPQTFAALRQARAVLEDEHGCHLDDDAFVAALAATVLDGARGVPAAEAAPDLATADDRERGTATSEVAAGAAPTGRARYQIAVTICERCRQGWQHGAGAK